MVKNFLEQSLCIFQIVMLKYVRVPVSAQMLTNMCYKMSATKCRSTEKNVRYSGVFVIAKTPL